VVDKRYWLTFGNLTPINFVNNGKYQTFVDLVILNPTITVILIANSIPQSLFVWFPIIRERLGNKILLPSEYTCKSQHISYTMGTRALTDIYTLALGQV